MNVIEYNAKELLGCTKIIVPDWYKIVGLSLGSATVSTHSYDFVEYRDSSDNVLLRHTLATE